MGSELTLLSVSPRIFLVTLAQLTDNLVADIPAADLKNIISRLSREVYITQEVIPGQVIKTSEYTGHGEASPILMMWMFVYSSFNLGNVQE